MATHKVSTETHKETFLTESTIHPAVNLSLFLGEITEPMSLATY
jgi:hypothetical protein